MGLHQFWGKSSVAVIIASLSLQSYAFETASSSFYSASTYSGHEEITRQALNNISKKIKETGDRNNIFNLADLNYDLLPEPRGLFGYKSQNMIIHGNFTSDFPEQTTIMSLAKFWQIPNIAVFENPDAQVIHFLRNYKGIATVDSAKNTCLTARENIKRVTSEALKFWENGDKTRALFLIGHATHTIQDSFSPAHTIRADERQNNNIMNVCYFGGSMRDAMRAGGVSESELCFHEKPDARDAVWNMNPRKYQEVLKNWGKETVSQCDKNDNYPETEEAKTSCMSNEARLARVATEKFLFLVFNQIKPEGLVKQSIENFVNQLDSKLFDGPVGDAELDKKMPKGIMRCENLSDRMITAKW